MRIKLIVISCFILSVGCNQPEKISSKLTDTLANTSSKETPALVEIAQ